MTGRAASPSNEPIESPITTSHRACSPATHSAGSPTSASRVPADARRHLIRSDPRATTAHSAFGIVTRPTTSGTLSVVVHRSGRPSALETHQTAAPGSSVAPSSRRSMTRPVGTIGHVTRTAWSATARKPESSPAWKKRWPHGEPSSSSRAHPRPETRSPWSVPSHVNSTAGRPSSSACRPIARATARTYSRRCDWPIRAGAGWSSSRR